MTNRTMGSHPAKPACLNALTTIRAILVALRDKTDDPEFGMKAEARINDTCKMLHGLMDSCPDLFDDVMIEWIKGMDSILEKHGTSASAPSNN